MKNLINFVMATKELEKLGINFIKMKENEQETLMDKFLSINRVDTPDIDVDFNLKNNQQFTQSTPIATEEILHILKLAKEVAEKYEKETVQSLNEEVLAAIDKVSTIQDNLSYNRMYILKTNNVEAHRDLSMRYGAVWKEFLTCLNQLIDEIELIAIAMDYKSEQELHDKFNYLFGEKYISESLIKKGVSPMLVNSWLRIK